MPPVHELEVLSWGYGLVEGPRVDGAGNLYFSDVHHGGVRRRRCQRRRDRSFGEFPPMAVDETAAESPQDDQPSLKLHPGFIFFLIWPEHNYSLKP